MNLITLLALTGVVTAQPMYKSETSPSTLGRLSMIRGIRVDSAPIEEEMRYWQEWISNPQTQQDGMQVARGMEDAFNQAQLRIQIQGASVFRPIMNELATAMENGMVGKNCDMDAMFQCYWSQKNDPQFHQWGAQYSFLHGTCAKAHQCEPDNAPNDWQQYQMAHDSRINGEQFKTASANLGENIRQDTMKAMSAYGQQVQSIVGGYAATVNKIAKEAYKCEPGCTDRYTQRIVFNPIDLMNECRCQNPISLDMSSQYLFKSPDFEMFRLMKVNTPQVDAITMMADLTQHSAQRNAKVEAHENFLQNDFNHASTMQENPRAQQWVAPVQQQQVVVKAPSMQLVGFGNEAQDFLDRNAPFPVLGYVGIAAGVAILAVGGYFFYQKSQQQDAEGGDKDKQEKLI